MYLIIGTKNSGRREILFDLINSPDRISNAKIFLAKAESPDAFDEKIAALHHSTIIRYEQELFQEILETDHHDADVFLILNSREDMVDQLETAATILPQSQNTLDRILFVMDCDLAMRETRLKRWFEAATHFADCVLLNKRSNVTPGWMRDWLGHFEKERYPTLFTFVKKGRVENPDLVLSTTPLRMTLAFEEDDSVTEETNASWKSLAEHIDDDTVFTDDAEDEEDKDDDEVTEQDPYFERIHNGTRKIHLPDPNKFIE